MFQEVEAPRFKDNRNMKVVRLSAIRTGRLYPQETFLVLISLRISVDYVNEKNPMTPSGIELATFWFVAQWPQPTAPPAACPRKCCLRCEISRRSRSNVRTSVYSLVISGRTVYRIFMKFGVRVLHEKFVVRARFFCP